MAKKSKKKQTQEVLLFSDTDTNPDMLYFGGVSVPDPFIAFTKDDAKYAVVSALEFSRVQKESDFDFVYSLEEVSAATRAKYDSTFTFPGSVITYLQNELKIGEFVVDQSFPYGVALDLKNRNVKISVADGLLFPEREFKDDEEAQAILEGNAASSAGFRVVEKMLRKSKINKQGYLMYEGRRLTSEKVQQAVSIECFRRGAATSQVIAAGGDQACDPHNRGSGPLRANELIIVDIFPKVLKTGYHGDMTRTYLKGTPSDAQADLVNIVLEAEQWALGEHVSGRSGRKIYKDVKDWFTEAGYVTEVKDGVPVGFFHGLGHGLGLAVHEPPRVNPSGDRLKKGQVITVEPGLYYPGLGGVRFEDVIRVQPKVPEMLSSHHYNWHIR